MADSRIHQIAYNGLEPEKWIECQDYLMRNQNYPGSTFLDVDELRKSGRNIEKDFDKYGKGFCSNQFLDIGVVKY